MASASITNDSGGRLADVPRRLAGRTVGIIGLGQIGGSVVRRLHRYRRSISLGGTDRNPEMAARMQRYGVWCASIPDLVRRSDLVVVAVPVPAIIELLPVIAESAALRQRDARLVVVDTGTVKSPILRAARRYRTGYDYVGLHPLAGTQVAGWEGSSPKMFAGKRVVCCSAAKGRPLALARELIALLGGLPLTMAADLHDRLVATSIGLPHILALAARGLSERGRRPNPLQADSWASLTRVAASDPAMVAGFLSANSRHQAAAVRRFQRQLDRLIGILERSSPTELERCLRRMIAQP